MGARGYEDHTEPVRIRETGAGHDAGDYDGGRYDGGYYDGVAPGPVGATGRPAGLLRKPFLAAWLVTGALIGLGLVWLAGGLETPSYNYAYNSGLTVDGQPVEQPGMLRRNLAQIAPMCLLQGLVGAVALLIVQGCLKSRHAGGVPSNNTAPGTAPGAGSGNPPA